MKRFVAILAALCTLVAVYAVTAPAGQQAVSTAKFAKLNRQVKTLNKRVNKLNRRVNKLNRQQAATSASLDSVKSEAVKIGKMILCFSTPVPVNRYPGYATVGGTSATALDVAHSGDPVSSYLLAVHPLCLAGL
jgi:outer membrane murein-binding lipoprotein Lpp